MDLKKSSGKARRNIAVFTLLCFMVSQFSADASKAFAQSEIFDRVKIQSQSPDLFQGLPQQIGTVKKIWQPAVSKDPFVVIIQDAHANPEAQNNIKKLLLWFRDKNQSIKSKGNKPPTFHVALENLSGTLHPEYFDFFPEIPEANQRTIEDLAAKGELTGPELFAWEVFQKEKRIPEDIQIRGVENVALYKENLRLFQSLLLKEEPARKDLEAIEVQLNKSAGLLLSKDLYAFLKEKQTRKDGQYGPSGTASSESGAQLSVYLHFLETAAAEKLKINLNDKIEQIRFPAFSRWKAAEGLDKEISRDPNRYHSAWTHLQETLMKSADPDEKIFLKSSLSNWASNPNARALAEKFLKIAQKHSPTSLDLPDSLKLLERWVLVSEMIPDEIMSEVKSIEDALIQSLAKTEADKKLMDLIQDFSIYRDCLMLKLAERDFEAIKTRGLIFYGESWKKRLEQDGKIKIASDMLSRLDRRMQSASRFYEGAKKRDSNLVENTIQENQDSHFVVLVAGGFHAAGMAQKLEKRNVPYVLIQPAITKFDGPQFYASVMKGLNAKLPDGVNNDFFTTQQAIILKSLLEVALPEALRRFSEKKELIFDGVKKFADNSNIFSPDFSLSISNFSAAGMDLNIHYGNTTIARNSIFRPPVMAETPVFEGILPARASKQPPADAHYQFHIGPSGQTSLAFRAEIRALDNNGFRSGRPRHRQVVNFKWREGTGPNAPIREVPIEIALGGNRSLDFRLASEEYSRGSKTLRRGPTPVTPLRHFFNENRLNRNIGQGHFFSGQLNHTEYGDGAILSGFDTPVPIFVADLNQRRGRILAGDNIKKIGPGPAAVQRKLSEMKKNIESQNAELPAYLAFHIDDVLIKKKSFRKTPQGHHLPEFLDKDRKDLLELLIWFIQKDVPIAFLSNNDSEVIQEVFLEPLRKTLSDRGVDRALPLYFYTNGMTNHGVIERINDEWAIQPHISDYDATIRIPKHAVDTIKNILGEINVNDKGNVRLGSSGLLPKYYRTLATHNGVHFAPSAPLAASFPDLKFETTLGGDFAPPVVVVSQGDPENAAGNADMISIRSLISYASAASEDSEASTRINLGESEYDPRERLLAAVAAELIEYSENSTAIPPRVAPQMPGPVQEKASEAFGLDLNLLLGVPIDEHTVITEQIIFNLRKLFGVEDLIASQLPAGKTIQEGPKQKAVDRMLKAIRAMQRDLTLSRTHNQFLNLENLERRDFLSHFGTQALFRVSTDDVKFSTIIPRSFARGKLTKPDTAYALSGFYRSPGTQPIVILNSRVLGHLLKSEYIKSVDPEKMIFEFTDDIPISHNQEKSAPIVINPEYLDVNKVYHYLGIPPAYMPDGTSHMNAVFLYNKTNQGDGEELAAIAKLIKAGLPRQPKVKFLQRARTDHPTVALDTFSNVSFMTYLELLGSSSESPEKPLKAIAALQPVQKDAKGIPNLRGQTVPFYDSTGELMGLFDWSKIPHGDGILYNEKIYTPEKDYIYQKFSLRGRLESVKRELDALTLKYKMQQILEEDYMRELQGFYDRNAEFFENGKLQSFRVLYGKIRGTVSYVEERLHNIRGLFANAEINNDEFARRIQELRHENPFFVITTDGYLLTRELILESITAASKMHATEEDKRFLAMHFKVREGTNEFLVATRFNSFDLESLSHLTETLGTKDPNQTTSYLELMGGMRDQVQVVDYFEPLPQQVRSIADHGSFEAAVLAQDPFQRSLPSMNARTNAVESYVERLKTFIVNADADPDHNSQHMQRSFAALLGKSIDPENQSFDFLNMFESIIRSLLAESYNQTWQFPLLDFLLNIVESNNEDTGFSDVWKNFPNKGFRLAILRFRIRALLAEATDTGTIGVQAFEGYLENPKYAKVISRLKNYFSKIHNAAEGAESDHPTDYILERLADVITEQIYRAPALSIEEHLRLRKNIFGPSDLHAQVDPELSVIRDGKAPVSRIFGFTGGTLLQATYAKAFALMGLLDPDLEDFGGFFSYVANTDDGGHSYAIVKSFVEAFYGVLVALGDIGNSLSGFVSSDKRRTIMGNEGRIPENSKSELFSEAIRNNIWKAIADPRVAEMNPDFFMFAHSVIDLMRELDNLNAQIKQKKKTPLRISKASLRNLFSAALLFHAGLIRHRNNPETPMISTPDEIQGFEEAIQNYVDLAGAYNYHGSVTSFDPKTLFALYAGYTLKLKDKNGRIETLVLTPKYDKAGKIASLTIKNPQPVSKIPIEAQPAEEDEAEAIENVAYSRLRTPVTVSLNPGESVRVDDQRLKTEFTDTPIEISLRDGHIRLQIEDKFYTLVEDGDKAYHLVKSEPGSERPYTLVENPPNPEASPLDNVYLRSDDGIAENNIFLSTDGTGRRAEWGGYAPKKDDAAEMAKQALFRLQNGMSVNLLNRVVKSQSFITEVPHDSTIDHVGLLHQGRGTKGVVPKYGLKVSLSSNPLMIKKLQENAENGKRDLVFFGPGSPLTSLSPIFLVKGLAETLAEKKKRGDKIVLVLNSTFDNESANWKPFEVLKHFQQAISRHSPGLLLEDIFTDITVLEKDSRIPADILERLDVLTDTIKRGDPNLSDHDVDSIAFNLLASELVPDLGEKEKEDFVKLLLALYPRLESEERYDPSAASHAAKRARGPMGFSDQDFLEEIAGRVSDSSSQDQERETFSNQHIWRNMKVHFLPADALIVQGEQARVPGAQPDYRAVFSPESLAEILKTIVESPSRHELRTASSESMPRLDLSASTESLEENLSNWLLTPQIAAIPDLAIPVPFGGIYSPFENLARSESVSDAQALAAVVRALLNPSVRDTSIGKNILKTAKDSLGEFGFLLDRLSEQPVHLGGVIGDKVLNRDFEDFANLLILLELASREKFSMTYLVADDDGIPGIDMTPFTNRLRDLSQSWGINPEGVANRLRFQPLRDSGDKSFVRTINQDFSRPVYRDSAKGVLHESLDLLGLFGYQKTLARIHQGDINYETAILVSASLLREKLGEPSATASIWNLHNEIQRLGGIEALVTRVASMISNIRRVSQAA